jgi:hypothetical protein
MAPVDAALDCPPPPCEPTALRRSISSISLRLTSPPRCHLPPLACRNVSRPPTRQKGPAPPPPPQHLGHTVTQRILRGDVPQYCRKKLKFRRQSSAVCSAIEVQRLYFDRVEYRIAVRSSCCWRSICYSHRLTVVCGVS